MELFINPTTALVVWTVLLAFFVVVEIATLNLVTIWFAAGALAALLASLFTQNLVYQILIFLLVSLAALVAAKPLLANARHRKPAAPLDLERNLGRTAQVLEPITPQKPGRVRLDGVDWNAVCQHPLAPGDQCRVLAIEGTTLTVEPCQQTTHV